MGMESLVENFLVLVTGADSELGREACEALAREGATLIMTSLDGNSAEDVCKRLPGSSHSFFRHDVADFKAISPILQEVRKRYGRPPNILVNCAEYINPTPLMEETPTSLQKTIDTNLKGTFFTSQAFYKELIPTEMPGAIVNVSGFAEGESADTSSSAASKAAVEAMTRTMASDMAKHGIRVNAVVPCRYSGSPAPDIQERTGKSYARKVAEVIVFLASERSSCLNGAIIPASV